MKLLKTWFQMIKNGLMGGLLPVPTETLIIESAPEKEKMALEPVKELFEDYIGVVIIGFEKYRKDISNLEYKIQTKLISRVEIKNDVLILKLSSVSGLDAGYLKLEPTINGEFASFDDSEDRLEDAVYRIIFYGDNVVEYADYDQLGLISYYSKL